MLLFNLLYYILGYVKIELRGFGTEKFINLAVKQRVIFWDVKRKSDKIEMKTPVKYFDRLKGIAIKTGCEIKISEKKGIPFYLKKINKRKGFIVGVVFFVTVLYYLSSYVWFVEVTGNEKVPGETILEITERQGLRPGVKKDELDTQRIAELITAEDDCLVWAGIELKGMRALVEVVERVEEDREFYGDGNIVALEEGVVEKIVALSGFPLVSRGDEVSENETLIAGRIVPTEMEDHIELEELEEYPKVEVKGFIYGRMSFDHYVEVPLERTKKKRTTNRVTKHGIRFGDKILDLDLQDVPYIEYDKEKIERQGISEDFRPPFNLVKKVYYETKEVKEQLTQKEAEEEAREKLNSQLYEEIPANSKIVKQEFENLGVEAGKLRMILRTEVEGNMGVLESF